jgi:hypothetical protein
LFGLQRLLASGERERYATNKPQNGEKIMANHLFIVPGYSDEDFSFLPLKNLLVARGLYDADKIQSIEYASLDDQVDFRDFGDKFNDIYNEFAKRHPADNRIDILAHSTGSLVVRAWLYMRRIRQRRTSETLDVPVDHLFLFAPANFGSDLAKIGRSGLNAVRVTFTKMNKDFTLKGNQHPFETGKRVLEGLEPASPTQWELSTGDLHTETYFGEHDPTGKFCFPFIFAAGKAEKTLTLKSIIIKELQKDGTDSTVRIAGTSLNTRLYTLRSKAVIGGKFQPEIELDDEFIPSTSNRRKYGQIAFAIFGQYDHVGIINDNGAFRRPRNIDGAKNWNPTLPNTWEPFELLEKAKKVETPQDYNDLVKEFSEITKNYINPKENKDEEGIFQQFFFKVTDDTEQNVKDFFIQFLVYKEESYDNELTKKFRNLFGDNTSFHFHSVDNSYGVLMLDITRVKKFVESLGNNNQIKLKITAKSAYNGVSFPDSEFVVFDKGSTLSDQDQVSFFFPFTTTLVKVVLDRKVDESIITEGNFSPGS